MALPVVTVASGGLPVVAVTATPPTTGLPVTEASNGRGLAVTKVVGKPGMPVVYTTIDSGAAITFDPATVTAVTLSSGNLVATNTGTSATEQGAKGSPAAGKAAGKYYFEITVTVRAGGGNVGLGVGTIGSTYTGMGNSAVTGTEWFAVSGAVWSGGSNLGASISWVSGIVCGVAADLDNHKFWIRSSPSGNWNGNASYDPATNTGGFAIPAGTMVPYVTFGGSGGTSSGIFTANFGASAFSGAVPSGFTAGWLA